MNVTLPEWPVDGTPEATRFFASAKLLAGLWKAKNPSHPFILAMVAQAEAESDFDPNALGDWFDQDGRALPWAKTYPPGARPTSFGLYQWKPERCAAIKAGTGVDIMAEVTAGTATLLDAVRAAAWEIGPSGPFADAGRAIAAQHSAYMASYEAAVLFERASAPNAAAKRANQAERWAVWFTHNGGL